MDRWDHSLVVAGDSLVIMTGGNCRTSAQCNAAYALTQPVNGRGLHSFTLELNLCNSRTHPSVHLGYTVDRRAQVELKWERV